MASSDGVGCTNAEAVASSELRTVVVNWGSVIGQIAIVATVGMGTSMTDPSRHIGGASELDTRDTSDKEGL